ncbi:MAG TPA: RNA methyltransferase [Burkholderiales bacterium]|jgi:TrmH family RNA methyltransferase|nr:RNA methyltransferase [Burkholderiales bacterium]
MSRASIERITSRQNAHFKLAHKLAESSRERHKAGKLLLVGTRLVDAYALHFGKANLLFLLNEAGRAHPEVRALLDGVDLRQVFVLDDVLFHELAQVETPEGILGMAPIPHVAARPRDDFRILVDGVQDPGNLGGLLRTAAAAGATSAHLTKGCADPWSPKSLRGGMGAQFVLPIRERVELATALTGFRGTILATVPGAELPLHEADLTGPVAFLFGAEGRGLGEEGQALANQRVRIPMAEGVESLNVAAAAAVCCFERQRQVLAKAAKVRR